MVLESLILKKENEKDEFLSREMEKQHHSIVSFVQNFEQLKLLMILYDFITVQCRFCSII